MLIKLKRFAKDAYLTLPRSMTAGLDKSVVLNEPLIAPIAQGDEIGKVVWKAMTVPWRVIPWSAAKR